MLHVKLNDDQLVKELVSLTFPSYRGRKFKIQYGTASVTPTSYWDGGSRTVYRFVNVETRQVLSLGSNHPAFDKGSYQGPVPLEGNVVCVAHSIFCGKDMGITIYTANPAPLLPLDQQLTDVQINVLYAHRSLKSSYAGIKDYRANDLRKSKGYTMAEITAAREALHSKGYLKRNGITNEGRNLVGSMHSYK